VIILPEEDYYQ